ncbi:putative transcription factor MYB-HB-like family [Helianthus anomalus]
MGVPKQRWTPEEEAALKAGVVKHGPGKWSTILKDPEFESVLRLRSNVDLKDKWRNMHSMPGGCGSRQRARPTRSKAQPVFTAFKDEHDMQICLPDSSTALAETLQYGSSKRPMPRLYQLFVTLSVVSSYVAYLFPFAKLVIRAANERNIQRTVHEPFDGRFDFLINEHEQETSFV